MSSLQHSTYQIDSNDPGEDRVVTKIIGNVSIFAVIDGHGGGLACTLCAEYLIGLIEKKADIIHENDTSPEIVAEILCEAFIQTDSFILDTLKAKSDALDETASMPARFAPFKAGCCALIMVTTESMIYIAHVGDSRAIYCSKSANMKASGDSATTIRNFHKIKLNVDHLRSFSTKTEGPAAVSDGRIDDNSTSNKILYDEELILTGRYKTQRGYDVGGVNFAYKGAGLHIQGVTLDHTCQVSEEVAVVKYLTSDEDPIRQSENDKRKYGTAAIPRVAGSLAVTRAIGDGYLKRSQMSLDPFLTKVPYITCIPTVSYKKRSECDVAIILASDGFWNFIKLNEIATILSDFNKNYIYDEDNSKMKKQQQQQGEEDANSMEVETQEDEKEEDEEGTDEIAKILALKCLHNAADSCKLDAQVLIDMPPGPRRRGLIDDISVIAVHL